MAGLQPSASYRLHVFVVNRHGSSEPSGALRVHTEPEPPGGPPLGARLRPADLPCPAGSPVTATTEEGVPEVAPRQLTCRAVSPSSIGLS